MPSQPETQLNRHALVIATGRYSDTTLRQLRAPGQDATKLREVLADPSIGGFDVVPVLDAPSDQLKRSIVRFCTAAGPNDLILLYLSCHGVLDDRGRLYYATVDTERDLLSASAIRADWLNEQLEDSRSRRQVVVLDCCHSGAFAKGAKGDGALALEQRFEGRGRIVFTASRATEYSFEGSRAVGEGTESVFTAALVEGLRSGDADIDGDGVVTVSDLYTYVYDRVRSVESRQTPSLWTYGAEGTLMLARNPRGAVVVPATLPEHLRVALESPAPRVREGAVYELAAILSGLDAQAALRARLTLEEVQARDIPQIADAARAALRSGGATGEVLRTPPPVSATGEVLRTPPPASATAGSTDQQPQRATATIPHPVATLDGSRAETGVGVPAEPPAGTDLQRTAPRQTAPGRSAPSTRVRTHATPADPVVDALFAACYILATLAATALASLLAREVVGFTDTRWAQIAFALLVNGPVFAAWFLVMEWMGHTRVSGRSTAAVALAATLASGLMVFAADIKTLRVELVVEIVWFAVLFAVSVAAVARSRAVLLVASTTSIAAGGVAALLVPLGWSYEYTDQSLIESNVVLNGAVVIFTALYLTHSGWERKVRPGPLLRRALPSRKGRVRR